MLNSAHITCRGTLLLNALQEISGSVSVGHQKLKEAQDKGDAVLPQTSSKGQELIKEELSMLAADFEGFETDLATLTETLSEFGNIMYLNDYVLILPKHQNDH